MPAPGAERSSIYIEAIQAVNDRVLSDEAWEALCAWRDRTGVPLVLSEVSSGFGRVDEGSGDSLRELGRDLVLWWAGRIGHIFCRPKVFVAKPLTLISTWDGDELSATRLLWQLYATRENMLERVQQLSTRLDEILSQSFTREQIGGKGLYRTVQLPHASLLYEALRGEGVQLQRLGDRICIAPPITATESDLDLFALRLNDAMSRIA